MKSPDQYDLINPSIVIISNFVLGLELLSQPNNRALQYPVRAEGGVDG